MNTKSKNHREVGWGLKNLIHQGRIKLKQINYEKPKEDNTKVKGSWYRTLKTKDKTKILKFGGTDHFLKS